LRTLVCPPGSVREADAVDEAKVPVEFAVTDVAVVNGASTTKVKVVGTGVLVASMTTVTGLVVPGGIVTSAVVYVPPGTDGVLTPPMVVIRKVGKLVSAGVLAPVIGPGIVTTDAAGFVA
jgi:hypothetical protein